MADLKFGTESGSSVRHEKQANGAPIIDHFPDQLFNGQLGVEKENRESEDSRLVVRSNRPGG